MAEDQRPTVLEGDGVDELVGHVIVRRGGRVWAVPVVEVGFVDEPAPGQVGDSIEHRRIRGVPAYRVWRAAAAEPV